MCSNTFAVVGLFMHDMGLHLKLLGKKSESFKIQNMPKAIQLQLNVELRLSFVYTVLMMAKYTILYVGIYLILQCRSYFL